MERQIKAMALAGEIDPRLVERWAVKNSLPVEEVWKYFRRSGITYRAYAAMSAVVVLTGLVCYFTDPLGYGDNFTALFLPWILIVVSLISVLSLALWEVFSRVPVSWGACLNLVDDLDSLAELFGDDSLKNLEALTELGVQSLTSLSGRIAKAKLSLRDPNKSDEYLILAGGRLRHLLRRLKEERSILEDFGLVEEARQFQRR